MEYRIGELNIWGRKALEKVNRQKREIILRLFRSVIMDTPVEEGTLRANWRTSDSNPITEPVSSNEWQKAIEDMTRVVNGADLNNTEMFLTNNLPYGPVVEYGLYPNPPKSEEGKTIGGFSKKAPAGMVRRNVMRFHRIAVAVRSSVK